MDAMNSHGLAWFLIAIQIFGLISMAVMRLQLRREFRLFSLSLFFVCLFVVGAVTMLAVGSGNGQWLATGTTFSLMSVGSILDLGRNTAAPV